MNRRSFFKALSAVIASAGIPVSLANVIAQKSEDNWNDRKVISPDWEHYWIGSETTYYHDIRGFPVSCAVFMPEFKGTSFTELKEGDVFTADGKVWACFGVERHYIDSAIFNVRAVEIDCGESESYA